MRFGFFTDLHARADSPEGRTDEFRRAILDKLEAVGDIFEEAKVSAVLFGGDLFHTPDPANSVINEVMWRLRKMDLPIYAVVGSHDYFGYQPKTLNRTALGLLNTAEILLVLPFHDTLLIQEGKQKVLLAATHHSYTLLDEPDKFFVKRVDDTPIIQLVHADLVAKPVPWPHIRIEDMKTQANLVLSGHVHSGWEEPLLVRDTIYFNPGSVARLENTGKRRTPRVVLFDVVNNKIGNFSYPEIPCAKHPFREKFAEEESGTMQDVTRLIQLMERSEVDTVDVKAQLRLIGQETGATGRVIDRSFQLLEEGNK